MCSFSTTRPKVVEEAEMSEKPLNHDVEQAGSDLTITIPNHRPSTLLAKLASLPSSASLSQSSKFCPISPQIALILAVAPMLELMFETEKTPQMQGVVATTLGTVMSTFSDRVDTDDSLLTDTEQSRPTTGITTVFEQTEATSPAPSTSGDQVALSWRQRMSRLGSDPFPSFSPRRLSIKDIEGDFVRSSDQSAHTPEEVIESYQSASVSLNKIPSSGPVLEFHPSASGIRQSDRMASSDTNPAFPLIRSASMLGCNPLALEWRPSDKTEDMDMKNLSGLPQPTQESTVPNNELKPLEKSLIRPQLTVAVPKTSTVRLPEQVDNARVLEWAKSVLPTQPPDATIIPSPYDSIQVLSPGKTTTAKLDASSIQGPLGAAQGSSFAPRQTTIATPSDIRRVYHRPTLAQRRAGKQFGQPPGEVEPSAPSTAPPRLATLHTTPEVAISARTISSRAAVSPSLQATPSQFLQSAASHTQSLCWKRAAQLDTEQRSLNPELARWTKVEQDLLSMGLIKRVPGKPDSGSFVVPRNLEQWLGFRAGRTEDALAENAAQIRQKSFEGEASEGLRRVYSVDDVHGCPAPIHRSGKRVKINRAMGGKSYRDGRGTVLAHPSTWSPWYQPTDERPEARWPCIEEMKEEGDERHTSAFGRFPALPRVPGNLTVMWKVKPVIPPLPFDEVWNLPNKDTWAELHRQKLKDPDESYMEGLIGPSLLGAIGA